MKDGVERLKGRGRRRGELQVLWGACLTGPFTHLFIEFLQFELAIDSYRGYSLEHKNNIRLTMKIEPVSCI